MKGQSSNFFQYVDRYGVDHGLFEWVCQDRETYHQTYRHKRHRRELRMKITRMAKLKRQVDAEDPKAGKKIVERNMVP